MQLTTLSQASALNPGADLWIVPDLESSPWAQKIDWYLNFQLVKSMRHQRAELHEDLKNLVKITEQNIFDLENYKSLENLMIISNQQLPNKCVVMIPWRGDLKVWAQEVVKTWSQLAKPGLRVFLPPGFSTANLEAAWPQNSSVQDLTVVLD